MKNNGIDRLPPYAEDMERGVLGCVLVSPQDCMAKCIEKLKAGQEVFYDLRHQTIYAEFSAMHDQLVPIEVLTVQQRLKDRQILEQVGGIPYLTRLANDVTSVLNLEVYLDAIIEKHQLRRLVQTCTEAACRAYEHAGDVEPLLDEVERDVLSVRVKPDGGARPIRELVQSAIGLIEQQFERKGEISGLATGFIDLDRMTDGLHGGEMIVIAGRPSLGKTALGMNIAEHVALNLQIPVGVFSLEMSADQLIRRSMCSLARVNLRDLRDGFMNESMFPKLTSAAGRISQAPLYIDDTAGLSIMQMRARARRMWQQHGIKLFVVDYLQLMHSSSAKAQDNRQIEISEISGGVKALAKELNVPVIILSQLNREIEKTKGGRPLLSHLRESGAVEQDADVVGLLYRPGKTDAEQNDTSDGIPVNLLIAKQRCGPTGEVWLTFLKNYTRFEPRTENVEEEDVPKSRSRYADA